MQNSQQKRKLVEICVGKLDDIATSLAVDAIKQVGEGSFTVFAQMNVDKPETLQSFDRLKSILLEAYNRGAAEAIHQKENEALPEIVGTLARRMRMYSIGLVFHDGHIEGGPGGSSASEALERAISDQEFSPECAFKMKRELLGSLFDASKGFDLVHKAV